MQLTHGEVDMTPSQKLIFSEIIRDIKILEQTLLTQAESKNSSCQSQDKLLIKNDSLNSWSKFEVVILPYASSKVYQLKAG